MGTIASAPAVPSLDRFTVSTGLQDSQYRFLTGAIGKPDGTIASRCAGAASGGTTVPETDARGARFPVGGARAGARGRPAAVHEVEHAVHGSARAGDAPDHESRLHSASAGVRGRVDGDGAGPVARSGVPRASLRGHRARRSSEVPALADDGRHRGNRRARRRRCMVGLRRSDRAGRPRTPARDRAAGDGRPAARMGPRRRHLAPAVGAPQPAQVQGRHRSGVALRLPRTEPRPRSVSSCRRRWGGHCGPSRTRTPARSGATWSRTSPVSRRSLAARLSETSANRRTGDEGVRSEIRGPSGLHSRGDRGDLGGPRRRRPCIATMRPTSRCARPLRC